MLANTLTFNAVNYDKIYATINNSKFSVEGQFNEPKLLTVRHNTNQGITSTAVEFVDDAALPAGSEGGNSRLKLLVKLQYDGKRLDTQARLVQMLADVKSLIDSEITSLLNKEV